jgi:predicted kinase
MEAVLLIGIQAAGKSTFYLSRFADTHIRINLDMLRTRHRESILLRACLEMRQPFVIDNTNITRSERARYIAPAREAGFQVIGYYFQSKLEDALARNEARPEEKRIPTKGVRGMHSRLEIPSLKEGFDQLFYVRIDSQGDFAVEEWKDEV